MIQSGYRIGLLALLILIGCSGGYMYIPPVSDVYMPLDVDAEVDLIPYCDLWVGLFQADEPPQAYRAVKKRLRAATTIVVYAPPMIIEPVEVPSNPDSARWEAGLEYLTWEARFVTKASWWNPGNKGDVIEQVLEHEQGHFAITELEVWKETALTAETIGAVRVTGPTQEVVIARVNKLFELTRKRVRDRVLVWNSKYDLETKNGSDKVAQREWTQRLQERLEEMEGL